MHGSLAANHLPNFDFIFFTGVVWDSCSIAPNRQITISWLLGSPADLIRLFGSGERWIVISKRWARTLSTKLQRSHENDQARVSLEKLMYRDLLHSKQRIYRSRQRHARLDHLWPQSHQYVRHHDNGTRCPLRPSPGHHALRIQGVCQPCSPNCRRVQRDSHHQRCASGPHWAKLVYVPSQVSRHVPYTAQDAFSCRTLSLSAIPANPCLLRETAMKLPKNAQRRAKAKKKKKRGH